MQRKFLFGIREELIEKTKSALIRKAEIEKKAKTLTAKQAKKLMDEQAKEILKDLAFLEAFKKQDNILDLVVYTGIINSVNVLISEPFLPLPAGVSYDSDKIQFLAPEKRSEIEEKMRKAKDVQLFSSKEEAIKAMTSI